MTRPPGHTLLELLIVLAMLGVLAAVTALAARPVTEPIATAWSDSIWVLNARAVEQGRPFRFRDSLALPPRAAIALPDGRVLIDTGDGVRLLTRTGVRDGR